MAADCYLLELWVYNRHTEMPEQSVHPSGHLPLHELMCGWRYVQWHQEVGAVSDLAANRLVGELLHRIHQQASFGFPPFPLC